MSASPLILEEAEEEEQSFWIAKKKRMRRKRRSTVEERSRCGQGESRMNLSHWIRAGRDEDGSITADEEQERSETHEEESHRIVSEDNTLFEFITTIYYRSWFVISTYHL